MALIKCPECGKDVSSEAENCIHCGYSIKKYLQQQIYEEEIKRLAEKILPCEFKVPAPRVKVCIKCTRPFSSILSSFRKPTCKCGLPGVEVDYQERYGGAGHLPTAAYILESCVIPRNIGDLESEEYQSYVNDLYRQLERGGRKNERTPPDPQYFGWEPTPEVFGYAEQTMLELHSTTPKTQDIYSPQCPICGSYDLSQITPLQKAGKIFVWGVYAAGDMSKTWKCNNCGSKF